MKVRALEDVEGCITKGKVYKVLRFKQVVTGESCRYWAILKQNNQCLPCPGKRPIPKKTGKKMSLPHFYQCKKAPYYRNSFMPP